MITMTPEISTMLIGALAALLLAVMGLVTKKLTDLQTHARATRHQVQNSHSSNLRDDIDRVLEGLGRVETTLNQHSAELEGIRADLRQERTERVEGDKATVAQLTVAVQTAPHDH